jgi:hypothetical protein
MTPCPHSTLELMPVRTRSLRCRRCHLTLDAQELGDSHCPECFETSGRRYYEFEEMEMPAAGATYRCEDCGIIVKCL